MKRAITALALVGALLLSVVACQVYNPTDNSTLYTAMRSEGATSWADYSKEFEEADGDAKYEILMEYEAFRKLESNLDYPWENKAEWVELYNSFRPAYETAKKALADAEAVVEKAGSEATQAQKDAVDKAKTTLAEKTVPLTAMYGSVEGLKTLWDKEFDVLWDWNSKM